MVAYESKGKVYLGDSSLRSKRFQSSYRAKVRAEAKKKRLTFPSPSPVIHVFFGSCPSFLDEPREETLATQARVILKVVAVALGGLFITMFKS